VSDTKSPSDSEMIDSIRDLHKEGGHPLQTDDAALATRAVEEFINVVLSWLDNLIPGGVVWAAPRTGKTYGLKYFMRHMPRLTNLSIPMTFFSMPDEVLTRNMLLASILESLGYATPHSGNSAIKRKRIIDKMVESVREMREHRYLFFVDEAQWLRTEHYHTLMDLHNQLKSQRVRLIVILVGQPELLERKRELRRNGLRQILGRFMAASYQFEGIADRTDFVRLCRALDEQSEWPEGSNIPFVQYFVPVAWAAGWRLQDSAAKIWDVMSAKRRQANLPTTGELPMQAIIALLRWLLQTLHGRDSETLVLDDDTVAIAYDRVVAEQLENHFSTETGDEE